MEREALIDITIVYVSWDWHKLLGYARCQTTAAVLADAVAAHALCLRYAHRVIGDAADMHTGLLRGHPAIGDCDTPDLLAQMRAAHEGRKVRLVESREPRRSIDAK
jgi:hypothetical protein